jgi:hypothetical protein
MITREAMRVLENNLTFTKGVSREFDSKFGQEGAKIGTVVNVRKPPKYVGRTGTAISIEDATETSVPVTLNTQRGVDISFTSQDLALSIDDFSSRFIRPAIASVGNAIDFDGLNLYKKVPNFVGLPGTVPATLLAYLQAGQKLNEEAAPLDGQRSVVVTPAMEVTLVDALKGLFNGQEQVSKQYETGKMGKAAGLKFSMDQNVRTHTVGQLGGTPLIDGATQVGASILTKGWTGAVANRLKEGDIVTFAGVYAVNPQSKQSTGALRQFVITADTASTVGGAATLPIYPAIVVSGAFQNVTASPADNAVILVFTHASTYASAVTPQGMAYHKDAFTLACADLPLPGGVDMAARVSDKQLGLSMRLIRAYDISTDKWPCRLDILYGWATLYPELAVRIAS